MKSANTRGTVRLLAAILATSGILAISSSELRAQTAHISGAAVNLDPGNVVDNQEGIFLDSQRDVFVVGQGSHNSFSSGKTVVAELTASNQYAGQLSPLFTATILSGAKASGIMVDASGNLFISTSAGLAKVAPPYQPIGNNIGSAVGSGLGALGGIAIDSQGNLFVTDITHNAVKELLAAGGYTTINTLGSGFSAPGGIAVDANENVFVVDTGNLMVKEIPAAGGYTTVNTLAPGFTFVQPRSIAVDSHDNVFVTDVSSTTNSVYEITAASGYSMAASAPGLFESTLAAGLEYGLAVDGSGNIYFGTQTNVFESPATLSGVMLPQFTLFGSPTASVAVTFDTGGSISAPVLVNQGSPSTGTGDAFYSLKTGTCDLDAGHVWSAGQTCIVDVGLTPPFAGLLSGAVEIENGSGGIIATMTMYSVNAFPHAAFSPAMQTSVASGFSGPQGIVADGSGNVFVADSGHNRVVEIPISGGAAAQVSLASGFASPAGMAVDGAGNLIMADAGNNAVKMITVASGFTSVINLGSGFRNPMDVALDGAGNVFVADTGNQAVKEILAGGGYTTVNTLGSGFASPQGVAVDANDNVFVADTGNHAIKEVLAAGGYITVNTLNSSLVNPSGLAVDPLDDVFVADPGLGAVEELTAAGNYATLTSLGSGWVQPAGLGMDNKQNIYISDLSLDTANELDRYDGPGLTFGPITAGTTSAAQTITLTNTGTGSLSFAKPASGATNPTETPALLSLTGSTCPQLTSSSSAASLAAGASCNYSIAFNPVNAGYVQGGLAINDSSDYVLNVSNQLVNFIGTATATSLSTPQLSWAAPAAITYGTALSASQLDAQSPVPGTFSYSPALGIVLATGQYQLLTATFTPNDPTTYSSATADVLINVNRAPLTITASASPTITYGSATGPTVTPVITGFVNGDTTAVLSPTLTCTASWIQTEIAGTKATASCNTVQSSNYTITELTTLITTTPAPLTITASNGAMNYGGTVPTITASFSGFVLSQTSSVLTTQPTCSTAAGAAAGNQPTTCSGAVASNYAISYVNGTDTVSPVPLTITAGSPAMNYGTVPTVAASYSGFVNNDTAASLTTAPSCTTTATATSAAGTTASTSCSSAADGNYSIAYVPGSLTVAKAPLTVTASSATMAYGGTVPTVTPVYSGFANGETSAVLTTPPTCSTTATATSAAGSNPATSCSGAAAANYSLSFVNGTITVNKAASVTAISASQTTVGAEFPLTLTATVTSTTTGTPTGSVIFMDGQSTLGTVALTGGVAMLPNIAFPTDGMQSLSANYGGDSDFTSSFNTVGESVVTPDFTVNSSTSAVSINSSTSGSATLTITPVGNYQGTVNLACSGLGSDASCQFSPASVTLTGGTAAQTVSLQIVEGTTSAAPFLDLSRRWNLPEWLMAYLAMFGLGLLITFRTGRGRRRVLPWVLAAGAIALAGCSNSPTAINDTAAVTASSSGTTGTGSASQSHQVAISVTIN